MYFSLTFSTTNSSSVLFHIRYITKSHHHMIRTHAFTYLLTSLFFPYYPCMYHFTPEKRHVRLIKLIDNRYLKKACTVTLSLTKKLYDVTSGNLLGYDKKFFYRTILTYQQSVKQTVSALYSLPSPLESRHICFLPVRRRTALTGRPECLTHARTHTQTR